MRTIPEAAVATWASAGGGAGSHGQRRRGHGTEAGSEEACPGAPVENLSSSFWKAVQSRGRRCGVRDAGTGGGRTARPGRPRRTSRGPGVGSWCIRASLCCLRQMVGSL